MSKVIIGTTLFVVLICSGYSATNIIEQPTNVTNKQEVNIKTITTVVANTAVVLL